MTILPDGLDVFEIVGHAINPRKTRDSGLVIDQSYHGVNFKYLATWPNKKSNIVTLLEFQENRSDVVNGSDRSKLEHCEPWSYKLGHCGPWSYKLAHRGPQRKTKKKMCLLIDAITTIVIG